MEEVRAPLTAVEGVLVSPTVAEAVRASLMVVEEASLTAVAEVPDGGRWNQPIAAQVWSLRPGEVLDNDWAWNRASIFGLPGRLLELAWRSSAIGPS